jgi:hypothetical protein
MGSQIPQLYIVDALGNVYGYLCLNPFLAGGIPLTYTLNGESTSPDGNAKSHSPTDTIGVSSPQIATATVVKKSKSKKTSQRTENACDHCKIAKRKCFVKNNSVECNNCSKGAKQCTFLMTPR